MRWYSGFAFAALLLACSGALAGQYNVTDLGPFGGSSFPFPPGGVDDGPYSVTTGMNANGEIVGWYSVAADSSQWFTHAFLTSYADPATITDLGTLGGHYSMAQGINVSGEIVGQSTTASDNTVTHAFLYSGGTITDLNSLLASEFSAWTLVDATAINDQGWIIGSGTNPAGQPRGLLLIDPVPEPSVFVLLGVGGASMAICAWLRWKLRRHLCPSLGVSSYLCKQLEGAVLYECRPIQRALADCWSEENPQGGKEVNMPR